MADLGFADFDFDADYSTQPAYRTAPSGTYQVEFKNIKQSESFDEGAIEFVMDARILAGEYEGETIRLYSQVSNPNAEQDWKVKSGRFTFTQCCKALGFNALPSDTDEMIAQPFMMKIDKRAAKSGKEYHIFKGASKADLAQGMDAPSFDNPFDN